MVDLLYERYEGQHKPSYHCAAFHLTFLMADEAVSSGRTPLICSNLAGHDIAKGGKSIVESLYNAASRALT
jgi:hypothetical protein